MNSVIPMLILFWKKQDDHHCFMFSLHVDELECGVYLSKKAVFLSRMTMKNNCSRFKVFRQYLGLEITNKKNHGSVIFSKIWQFMGNVFYLTQNFVMIFFQRTKQQFTCQIMDNDWWTDFKGIYIHVFFIPSFWCKK